MRGHLVEIIDFHLRALDLALTGRGFLELFVLCQLLFLRFQLLYRRSQLISLRTDRLQFESKLADAVCLVLRLSRHIIKLGAQCLYLLIKLCLLVKRLPLLSNDLANRLSLLPQILNRGLALFLLRLE